MLDAAPGEVSDVDETVDTTEVHKGTVWDAYNVLTEFATHTTLWGTQDHKRISLMNKATTMLRKKPDIVSYIEI